MMKLFFRREEILEDVLIINIYKKFVELIKDYFKYSRGNYVNILVTTKVEKVYRRRHTPEISICGYGSKIADFYNFLKRKKLPFSLGYNRRVRIMRIRKNEFNRWYETLF